MQYIAGSTTAKDDDSPAVLTTKISKVVLEANDDYWQTDELRDPEHEANVQTIEYNIISETAQHVIALSTGQIQYSEYVPSENIADFQEGGQYADGNDVYITQGSGLRVLMGNNAENSPMSDVNLRKAVYYAINNEAVSTVGGAVLPAKALGTSFFADYNPEWEAAENNYMFMTSRRQKNIWSSPPTTGRH